MAVKVGDPRRRQVWIAVGVLALIGAFIVRLVFVQVVDGPGYAAEALESRVSHVVEPAARGDILDTNGAVLAQSVERYHIVVDQKQVPDYVVKDKSGRVLGSGVNYAAERIAKVLGISKNSATERLDGTYGYATVAEAATPEQYRQIMEFGINGVTGVEFYQRVYPAGALAGNILGYGYLSSETGQPTQWTGIEGGMNKVLQGTDGDQLVETGLGGQAIPGGVAKGTPAKPGGNVQLTIDWDLQWHAQQYLDAQVKKTKASWGTAVVIDVKTGEVLALADSGSVNPNDPSATPAAERGSRAVETVFEPGSTAKVISMAEAIEEGVASPTSQYQVPSKYATANGQVFSDSHDHGTSRWTLTGILAQSSNVGTLMATEKIPVQVRYDYLARFGFGTKTGIELPSETAGLLHPVKEWDGRTEYAVLFGQGVSVNAIQATRVFATIGNGGVSMPIHLVKATSGPDGVLTQLPLGEGTRVVSTKTASKVMTMLESVVDDGTGYNAAIPGYRVVGKTGTSQMADAKGKLTKHASSFIGVVPADSPRYAIGVVMYEAKTSSFGGVVSAPVFKQIGSFALQQHSVPPSTTEPKLYSTTWK